MLYVSLTTYFCFLVLKYNDAIYQLNESKNLKSYIKNIDYKKTFITPELFSILLIVLALFTSTKVASVCFVIFYTFMFLYYLKHTKKRINIKKNIPLIIIISIIFILVNVLAYISYANYKNTFIVYETSWMYYIIAIVYSYLTYFIVFISGFINKIILSIIKKIQGS